MNANPNSHARNGLDHGRKSFAGIPHPQALDACSSFSVRAHSYADSKTSHMFFARFGRVADLKQSDGCSKRSDSFKILFDEIEF
jgi:hypothetical protein